MWRQCELHRRLNGKKKGISIGKAAMEGICLVGMCCFNDISNICYSEFRRVHLSLQIKKEEKVYFQLTNFRSNSDPIALATFSSAVLGGALSSWNLKTTDLSVMKKKHLYRILWYVRSFTTVSALKIKEMQLRSLFFRKSVYVSH
mmetsp:Transcript_6636/g.8957  ORF Transcript_6636/g.8957 Transcript_6636/m.8957 type:complete len:145 (-) Transcript_6636:137-571(-)